MRGFVAVGLFVLCSVSFSGCGILSHQASDLEALDAIASQDPKPFVIIGDKANGFGQGVVIREDGYVLTAAHVTFDEKRDRHPANQTVLFRKRLSAPWPDMIRSRDITYTDAGHRTYWQEEYRAKMVKQGESEHIDGRDIGLLKLSTPAKLPHIEFYSKTKPRIRLGDQLYMCQYCFPDSEADPIFLVTPMTVIGIAQNTTAGTQVLAQGFFRWGSSGSAILKDGKLIGIQSNGYVVNYSNDDGGAGETQLGHLSFEVVYEDMVSGMMEKEEAGGGK